MAMYVLVDPSEEEDVYVGFGEIEEDIDDPHGWADERDPLDEANINNRDNSTMPD